MGFFPFWRVWFSVGGQLAFFYRIQTLKRKLRLIFEVVIEVNSNGKDIFEQFSYPKFIFDAF